MMPLPDDPLIAQSTESTMRGAVLAANISLQALVWRQKNVVCDGCAESLAQLLVDTPGYDINTIYVGPNENQQLNQKLLYDSDIFAYGGGPDVASAWKSLSQYSSLIQNWVSEGGVYIGVCLGAYLAAAGTDFAPGDGFALLPGADTSGEECYRPGASVKNTSDTYISVDWTWGSGAKAGQTQKGVDLYFQDGNYIDTDESQVTVLGRYSSNGDLAVTVSSYGSGKVGISGVHVEADASWCEFNICSPAAC